MSGIFGVVSQSNCTEALFHGTDYHSHLGTEYGGLAVLGQEFARQIHNLSQSQFKSKFFDDYANLKGNKGIGVVSALDEQPIYLNSRFGPFCLATNGIIENAEELAAKLLKKGISFSEVGRKGVNTTELVAKLIGQGSDLVDGIEKMFDAIEGSCSLLLLNRTGIYAARDRFGYTPLIVGRSSDGWAVTSETCAFTNLGFEVIKEIEPGEVILINEDGIVQRRPGKGRTHQICSFLWIYTGFPASDYEGINVEVVRERCGRSLARRDRDIHVDLVAGIPDSGLAHGLGYAIESGKPFRRPLVKYTPGYGRSYTPPSQQTRDLIAKMKLIPIKEVIEGQHRDLRGLHRQGNATEELHDQEAVGLRREADPRPARLPAPDVSLRVQPVHAVHRRARGAQGHSQPGGSRPGGRLGVHRSQLGEIPAHGGLDRRGPGHHDAALPDGGRHDRSDRLAPREALPLLLDRPVPEGCVP
jgi:amidophosphoribosyltransferase